MNAGSPEVVVILVIVLVLSGARRPPEPARSMGRATGELREGFRVRSEKLMEAGKDDAGNRNGG